MYVVTWAGKKKETKNGRPVHDPGKKENGQKAGGGRKKSPQFKLRRKKRKERDPGVKKRKVGGVPSTGLKDLPPERNEIPRGPLSPKQEENSVYLSIRGGGVTPSTFPPPRVAWKESSTTTKKRVGAWRGCFLKRGPKESTVNKGKKERLLTTPFHTRWQKRGATKGRACARICKGKGGNCLPYRKSIL